MVITSIDLAKKQASAAAEATKKKASEVGSQIVDSASGVAKSVGQAVDTGMQAVEGGWHSVRSAIGI
jgi:MinD superfamily P-loop ATPase